MKYKIDKKIPIPDRWKPQRVSKMLPTAEKMEIGDSVMFPPTYQGYKDAECLSQTLNVLGMKKHFKGTLRTIRDEKTREKLGYRTWKMKIGCH